MHSNKIIHRCLSFYIHLFVRPSFSSSYDLKVMSMDTTLHFVLHIHVFQNEKKQRNDYFLPTLIIHKPKLAF